MPKIVPTAGVVVIQNKYVLLVRHANRADHLTGMYGLPAGKIKPGETPNETAKRELAEETGLAASIADIHSYPNNHYSANIETKSGEVVTYPFEVFYCTHCSGGLKETDETIPGWVEMDQIKTLPLLPNVDQAILDVQTYLASHNE